MIFTPDDHWAPVELKVEVEEMIPGILTRFEGCETCGSKPLTHDFVTTTSGSRHMAQVTADVCDELRVFARSR
jgi:hypothetical protein